MLFSAISPIIYGVLISLTYTLFKYLGIGGGINYFFWNCLILSALIFFKKPYVVVQIFKSKHDVLRSLMFASTQCFIFLGLNNGFVGDVTLISFTGVLGINIFYSIGKGNFKYLLYVLAPVFLISFFVTGKSPDTVVFSLAAGTLSGGTMLLTRASHKENLATGRVLLGNFLFSSIIAGIVIFMTKDQTFKIDSGGVLFATTIAVIGLQIYYFLIFKKLPAAFVGTLLLVRIPAAFMFDSLIFSQKYSAQNWAVAAGIMIVAFLITSPRSFITAVKNIREREKALSNVHP